MSWENTIDPTGYSTAKERYRYYPSGWRAKKDWWKTTVFYQIYPRSFENSNGDGVGDLNGVTSKLDHMFNTGVGAIWIAPIYPSPMADFGYDIAYYVNIDPEFGTLDDFDNLVAKVKELNLKVILDFAPNHSSDKHEWFQKSIRREDPYTNYYVWHDAICETGTSIYQPPNNWISAFQGSVWEWNDQRDARSGSTVQELKIVIDNWMNNMPTNYVDN
ncbi:maltase 1-like [Neodiprion fabricii]|uniref:maltase 1-like n=1 Tax=Neodiprion fabricii TaxID=2872261 RepID=UPI001ED9437C|nr:maltase 1-like [Neodiprion fabricii]